MPVKTKLSKRLAKALYSVADELRSFLDEEREAFDSMSERWRESQRATDIEGWREGLEDLAFCLEECRRSVAE